MKSPNFSRVSINIIQQTLKRVRKTYLSKQRTTISMMMLFYSVYLDLTHDLLL